MLWVNLIMDSLGSLALATEPPYNELLNRKPTNRNESIINGRMWKHIGFQAFFEICILLFLYLYAPKFVPESDGEIKESARIILNCFGELPGGSTKNTSKIIYGNKNKWDSDVELKEEIKNDKELGESLHCDYILPKFDDWKDTSLSEALQHYMNHYGGTTHMTLIFDIFVCYTLFNQINCRIIDDSFNTFKRISKGIMFCCVTSIELIIQVLLSQFGYKVFHCVHYGLSPIQWAICLGFSISTMIFNFIIKLIPLEKVIDPHTKGVQREISEDERARTTINQMVNQNLKE
jgi:magnesium-transporting ATPase (P-type)